jgi:hypothetical protein
MQQEFRDMSSHPGGARKKECTDRREGKVNDRKKHFAEP